MLINDHITVRECVNSNKIRDMIDTATRKGEYGIKIPCQQQNSGKTWENYRTGETASKFHFNMESMFHTHMTKNGQKFNHTRLQRHVLLLVCFSQKKQHDLVGGIPTL